MAQVGELGTARFSFGNQLIVQVHRPGTRRAATFKRWLSYGRHVKKGERGVAILAPVFRSRDCDKESRKRDAETSNDENRPIGFRPLTVFALEQTEGEPLPEPKIPDVVGEEAFDGSIERLSEVALAAPGRPVSRIEVRPRTSDDPATPLGWYDRTTKRIVVVTDDRTRAQQFRTLAHELAHALLHGEEDAHTKPDREVEAESAAFVVCHALGLDSGAYSFPYVGTWTQGADALAKIAESGQRITTAATRILDALTSGEAAATAAAA
jgi:antirestriction protein ArdC